MSQQLKRTGCTLFSRLKNQTKTNGKKKKNTKKTLGVHWFKALLTKHCIIADFFLYYKPRIGEICLKQFLFLYVV